MKWTLTLGEALDRASYEPPPTIDPETIHPGWYDDRFIEKARVAAAANIELSSLERQKRKEQQHERREERNRFAHSVHD